MRYIGIDYGSKRIGIALSDPDGSIAFPNKTMVLSETILLDIAAFIEKEEVGGIVVGDTRTLSGEANTVTEEADRFADRLQMHTGLMVHRIFEGWSSQEAARFAPKGKKHDDASAAAVILQRYLDTLGNRVQ
jgi:putative holliday junction resolvase